MHFSLSLPALLTALALSLTAQAADQTFTRLRKNDTAFLVVDHQLGLFSLVRDFSPDQYRNNILAHAALPKVFNIPTILTTSAETGPNGPLPHEIVELHQGAPFIKRNGEVNAWDNADFRAAVKATGKKQIVLAGITTDVCTSFLALSLRAEGYEVFANSDASGTFDQRLADEANDRMRAAGVTTLGMFAITMDLMRDWRNTPGTAEILPFLDKYLTAYAFLARAHGAAVTNGTLLPGETTS
ncbi:Isochorismatase hydrolase [Choiromyces venosus 120613-1]|uniref:Isochorismatase hydrolase n=1 Tax=Choiromyces venosus 120613-1 TaxID=1336337 RepID=A0A3N4JGC6_9PEZI|nr:Isochorismatase hydrolase [Choiromyces venosus 120613-1]